MALSAADLQRMQAQDKASFSAFAKPTRNGPGFFSNKRSPEASFKDAVAELGVVHASKTAQNGSYAVPAVIGPVANQTLLNQFLATMGNTRFNLQPQVTPAPAPTAEAARKHLPRPKA